HGPATPGPAAPTGPAGGKGPTTPRGIHIEDDATSWEFWWELNKDPYIGLKEAVRMGLVQSGSDEDWLRRARFAARDSLRPSDQEIQDHVLPALKKALDSTVNRDIASACMVAMAKIGKDHPDFTLFDKVFAKYLPSNDQEVREVAALAIGIAGLT